MAANMRCEKNSLSLLSSKRSKAFSRTRADEAFALPSFSDPPAPSSSVKSPQGPERCSVDVEGLKQTMLQHESMFKEQLYELHRLYQVQRMLMEESKRRGSATHPRSDSPSSNSSLLYNADSCKPKGETRFWDAKEAMNKNSLCKRLSFFPDQQIDVNKRHNDKSSPDRLVRAPLPKDSRSQRVVIDLERPAEEHMDIDAVEEKPFVSDKSLKTIENSQTWHANWQNLQFNTPSAAESVDVRSISMHRESLDSTRRSLEDCFTPEAMLPRHKEVPFFPVGPNKFGNSEASLCHVQTSPVTSLFGVKLNHESISREKQMHAGQNNLEEKRKDPRFFSMDACSGSTSESSKLPHWLLQSSASISAKMSPVKPASQNSLRQHQTLPFILQKHDERKADPNFYDRVSSISPQELSSSWPKSGTRLHFGESFLRTPPGKPPSEYFLDTSRENIQGFHKLAQTSNLNESIPFFLHGRDDRGGGGLQVPAIGYASSPTINKQSSVFDTHSTPSPFYQDLSSSKGPSNGALMPPWFQQQKASSTLMPQLLKPGTPIQGSPNAFSANIRSTWPHTLVHEEVEPGIFPRGVDSGVENKRDTLKGSSPSFTTKPEVSSKRLIFGFMPTASDLELTLGLDLNASDSLETPKIVEGPSVFEGVTPRDSKIDLESKPMRNDFDLNEQSSQDLDACCPVDSHAIFTGSKPVSKCEKSHGWQIPASGDKAAFCKEWPALYTSSDAKSKPEVAITSIVTSSWSANSYLTKVDTHREAPFAKSPQVTSANGGIWKLPESPQGAFANGSMFEAGKGSNGSSGTAICESRSVSIPVLPKARDGELCQSSEVQVSMHNEYAAYSLTLPSKSAIEKLFEEASMMAGRQPRTFLGKHLVKPDCLRVSQSGTSEDLLVAKCTNTKAFVNSGDEHAIEASDAADILLHLGLDLQAVVIDDRDTDDRERALKWLADIIPQEEISGIGTGMDDCSLRKDTLQGSEPAFECARVQERELDSFELSVLRLEPINPDFEILCTPPIERWELTEDCSPQPNLRRRSQRRGRVGKDFQKEMLPSMASLSRQEIAEDLQIIEGLVKSATEAMARCALSPKEEAPWLLPDLSLVKTSNKTKGSRSCKTGNQNGLLRVCSWGDSTRRRRMRRQRSQWMSLPPGI